MRLGVTEFIDSAHFLPGHSKCGQIHGHTYKVEVVVEGELKGGMLVDFAELRAQIREVFSRYDHHTGTISSNTRPSRISATSSPVSSGNASASRS